MIDTMILERLLLELRKITKLLDEMAARPYDDYYTDSILYLGLERALEIAIQCCIDIASHIISDDDLREPMSYADTFSSIAEAGVIPQQLSKTMEEAARFRNLLAHLYTKTDPTKVYSILQTSRRSFHLYMEAIRTYLAATDDAR